MSSKPDAKPPRPTLTARSSLSAHLRPPAVTRMSSGRPSRSATPVPHEQQHLYVPTFDDVGITSTALDERALFDDDNDGRSVRETPLDGSTHGYGAVSPAPTGTGEYEDASDDQDDDFEDDGRPEWRRASPNWVYPFIIGIPICLGMSMAPKAELYINLACLAHPPSASQDSTGSAHVSSPAGYRIGDVSAHGAYHVPSVDVDSAIGSDRYDSHNISITPPDRDLSPADKWFLRLQHDIYEYERTHHSSAGDKGGRMTVSPPKAEPTSPLPTPDYPIPHDEDENREPEGEAGRRGGGPFEEIDPQLCKKDRKVQATAAKLTMIMTTTMGVLAALTTGFWGGTSDRLGRTKVMAIVELGLLLNEICFIVVASFPYLVPGGYFCLLLGPTIEGLAGGSSTITATMYAYVSDVTPAGSRVTIFARLSGIFMAGFAVGPVLGSMLITATGNIMTPFYINACIFAIYIPLVVFVLPESLSTRARAQLAKTAAAKREEAARREVLEREWEDETPSIPQSSGEADPLLSGWSRVSISGPTASRTSKKTVGRLRRLTRKTFGFLEPLAVFIPTEREDGRGRNWNLTVVGLTILCIYLVIGIMPIKGQYSFYAYGWTSKQLGPFMSITAFTRSFVLIAIVPTVMRFVKPRFIRAEASASTVPTVAVEAADQSTSAARPLPSGTASSKSPSTNVPSQPQPQRSSHLDLLTVRLCLFIETIPYILLSLSPTATGFVLCSVLATFGAPSAPAINSLALSLLPDPSQSGRLFGAISVIQAMGTSLIGPLLYGTLFANTVGYWTTAIFALTVMFLVLAQISISFVRLDSKKRDVEEALPPSEGNTAVTGVTGGDDPVDGDAKPSARDGRGRSRRVKRVSSSSHSDFSRPSVHGSSGMSRVSGVTSGSGSGSAGAGLEG